MSDPPPAVQAFDFEALAVAESRLKEAALFAASGRPHAIREAIRETIAVIDRWESPDIVSLAPVKRLLTWAWLGRGNALRETGDPIQRGEALRCYDRAVEHFQTVARAEDPDDANLFAKLWINRGMALLDQNDTASLAEAVSCFERAIALRETLPQEQNIFFTWGLAAAWMNCADALTRLGSAAQLERALSCYDEAIPLLQRMPMDEHPTYRARLAVAWMNRGLTAQRTGTKASPSEALRCFTSAIEVFPPGDAPSHPEQRRVLACSRMNRGHALLNAEAHDPGDARTDALAAVRLMTEFERGEALAARVGLQARHLLCRAIACQIDLGKDIPNDWIAESTDAVDDGMALARHWRLLGEPCPAALETELFRFGALIYRLCQPHFLAEFLLDTMDPARSAGAPAGEEAMHHIATDALWSATMDINAQQQAGPSPTGQAPLFERLAGLQDAEERLTDLRLQHLAPKGGQVAHSDPL